MPLECGPSIITHCQSDSLRDEWLLKSVICRDANEHSANTQETEKLIITCIRVELIPQNENNFFMEH